MVLEVDFLEPMDLKDANYNYKYYITFIVFSL